MITTLPPRGGAVHRPDVLRHTGGPPATNSTDFVVHEFKAYQKNTLQGFLTIETPSGLVINGITLHEKSDSRWVSMPAKEYLKDGEKTWAPIIEFSSKAAREKFQAAALVAVARHLSGEKGL